MAKEYQFSWPGHRNLYTDAGERNLNVYFAEPNCGVNEKTGLLVLIPGFGGNSQSNVYRKMRSKFADDYNLITIQCDYFGQEFMQESQTATINIQLDELNSIFTAEEMKAIYNESNGLNAEELFKIGSKYLILLNMKEKLSETSSNFNDMGIMQAIDHLAAIYYVMAILNDNNLSFDLNRVILYGHSHGAYISYLCNAMAPELFTLLIDNSAWLFPSYLKSSRYLTQQFGQMSVQIEFDYLAKNLEYDYEFLSLSSLYKKFENQCSIISYHGTKDDLVHHSEKKAFCKEILNCEYIEISENQLDGKVFKSASHGLNADFIMLFDHVMKSVSFPQKAIRENERVIFNTKVYQYIIDYTNGVPLLERRIKN